MSTSNQSDFWEVDDALGDGHCPVCGVLIEIGVRHDCDEDFWWTEEDRYAED